MKMMRRLPNQATENFLACIEPERTASSTALTPFRVHEQMTQFILSVDEDEGRGSGTS